MNRSSGSHLSQLKARPGRLQANNVGADSSWYCACPNSLERCFRHLSDTNKSEGGQVDSEGLRSCMVVRTRDPMKACPIRRECLGVRSALHIKRVEFILSYHLCPR